MKYPKVPLELNRRVKLSPEDLERARELRNLGLTYVEIAESFEVTPQTIRYHLNEEFGAKVRQELRFIQAERWRNDPEFRKAKLKRGAESKRYLKKINPEYRKWKREEDKKYRIRRKLKQSCAQ